MGREPVCSVSHLILQNGHKSSSGGRYLNNSINIWKHQWLLVLMSQEPRQMQGHYAGHNPSLKAFGYCTGWFCVLI
jgi:hypothetical protein